jgi:integrase
VFAHLIGKGGHVRTVPVPDWVGSAIQARLSAAGPIFRAINKAGRTTSKGFSPKVIWSVVTTACSQCGLAGVAPHDLRRTCAHTFGHRKDFPSTIHHVPAAQVEDASGPLDERTASRVRHIN